MALVACVSSCHWSFLFMCIEVGEIMWNWWATPIRKSKKKKNFFQEPSWELNQNRHEQNFQRSWRKLVWIGRCLLKNSKKKNTEKWKHRTDRKQKFRDWLHWESIKYEWEEKRNVLIVCDLWMHLFVCFLLCPTFYHSNFLQKVETPATLCLRSRKQLIDLGLQSKNPSKMKFETNCRTEWEWSRLDNVGSTVCQRCCQCTKWLTVGGHIPRVVL